MSGVLTLVGLGEFTSSMTEVDRFLLSYTPGAKVAILPTAAGKEKAFNKWIAGREKHFKSLGVEAHGIPIRKRVNSVQ